MLKNIHNRVLWIQCFLTINFTLVLCFMIFCSEVSACSPGRTGARRRSARKLTPLVFKQHVPNIAEHSIGASGPPEGRIWRDDTRFKNLIPNYNSDIVFKDEEGTGVDRLMSRRCKEKLDILAISVMNMWPGIRLRVTEGFDEDGHHPKNSLHFEGRAVAISTSDRDISKYGMLARLAVDAGFDWVFYESRSYIYCSVKTETTSSSRFSGCFHRSSKVITKSGEKALHALEVGEEVLSGANSSVLFYSRVIGFLHRDLHFQTQFIEIKTTLNTLLVTPEHLLFTQEHVCLSCQKMSKSTVVHAREITSGDILWTLSENGNFQISPVMSVRYVSKTGVYAPLTEAGTVVVDGILSSCYAVVYSHDLAHSAFWPLRLIYKMQNSVPSAVVNMLNWASQWFWTHNYNVTHKPQLMEVTEIHWYARFLYELSEMFDIDCK